MVSRVNATADPSGEIAGWSRSASGSSAITRRSPEARSTRSSTERSVASGPVSRQVVTRNRPSALISNVASSNPALRSAPPGCGVRSRRSAASNRWGSSGPRSLSQKRTGYPECRIALTLLALRKSRSRRSSSTSRADANSGAPITVASALRAVRTTLTPPGMLSTSTASPPLRGQPPQRGRWFVDAIGVLGSGPRGYEQQVAVDGERRCGVSVRSTGKSACGSFAGWIDFPDGADVVGALVVEFGHGGHHPRPVRRHCQARDTWQCQIVVEVVEWRCGHESLVTQRGGWCGCALHDASVSLIFKL